jgi:hypothetical protein
MVNVTMVTTVTINDFLARKKEERMWSLFFVQATTVGFGVVTIVTIVTRCSACRPHHYLAVVQVPSDAL